MLNAATHGLRLLLLGLRKRNLLKIFAALDAIQPPVAILAACCVGIALWWAVLPGDPRETVFGILPLLLVSAYGFAVVLLAHKDGIKLTTVIWAPVYVAWRLMAFILAWAFFDRLSIGARRKGHKRA